MSAILAAAALILAAPGLARARCKFEQDEAGLERGKRHTVSAKMTFYMRFEFWRKSGDFFINAILGTILSGIDTDVTKIEFRYKDEGALSSKSWETRRGVSSR